MADYMKKHKLYILTLQVAHGLYIIGKGFAVKVQQTGDKLLVSDGPGHQSTTFIRVEKHIEKNCPNEWARLVSV